MIERPEVLEGVILRLEPSGESHLKMALLTIGGGFAWVMKKQSSGLPRRSRASTHPDWLDHCRVGLRHPGGGQVAFVSEYQLISRPSELARRPEALREAGAWCRLLLRMAVHGHVPDRAWELTQQGLAAWQARDALAVRFGLLHALAQAEGWPLDAAWEASLAVDVQADIRMLLAGGLPESGRIREVMRSLEQWLADHAGFPAGG